MLRGSVVVVVGCEAFQAAAEVRLADPPVEVDQVGMIALHYLRGTGEPIIPIGIGDVSEVVDQFVSVLTLKLAKLGRAVEGSVLRIVDIGGKVAAAIEEPVVLRAMG